MMGNNQIIIVFVLVYVVVILLYNVAGMMVTQIASAVVRTIMEAVRTLCIWVVQVIMHYGFLLSKSEYGKKHWDLGEELTVWSVLEFAGFLLLVSGTLLYNRILEMPFVDYPPKAGAPVSEQVDPQPLLNSGYD
jgi:choline-glycine betaine transporter